MNIICIQQKFLIYVINEKQVCFLFFYTPLYYLQMVLMFLGPVEIVVAHNTTDMVDIQHQLLHQTSLKHLLSCTLS